MEETPKHRCKYPEEEYDYQPRVCEICDKNSKCVRCHTKRWKGECEICYRALCNACSKRYKTTDPTFKEYVCNNWECDTNYKNNKAYDKQRYKGQTLMVKKIVGNELISYTKSF